MNPLFYVSSSPWNLYDLLAQFFNLQGIPVGPVLFLRDWGLTEKEVLPTHHRQFKTGLIRQMLDFYAHMPFILIGDSGQEDPEIYADLVKSYPKRIQAVYIRNISRDLQRPEAVRKLASRVLDAGSTLVLADDSLAIAKHALEEGYIAPTAIEAIRENKQKDEAPPTPVETLLGDAPKSEGEAPTVKVTNQAVKQGQIEKTLKETGTDTTPAPPTLVVDGKKKKNKE
jgi:phosphatidate phosphatase APP1